uniref:Uncharacterized protein n=1 Tax=Arundo donax TaxID=35708 RepID=A0A0A9AUW6_ARUDO
MPNKTAVPKTSSLGNSLRSLC